MVLRCRIWSPCTLAPMNSLLCVRVLLYTPLQNVRPLVSVSQTYDCSVYNVQTPLVHTIQVTSAHYTQHLSHTVGHICIHPVIDIRGHTDRLTCLSVPPVYCSTPRRRLVTVTAGHLSRNIVKSSLPLPSSLTFTTLDATNGDRKQLVAVTLPTPILHMRITVLVGMH